MDEIESKVIKIIKEQLEKDEADIKLESNFVDDLEADSDTVELVMALEEEFGIDIPDDAAEQIATVQSAVDYIKEQLVEDMTNISSWDKLESNRMWLNQKSCCDRIGMCFRLEIQSRKPGKRQSVVRDWSNRKFDPSEMRCQIAGEVRNFELPDLVSPKEQEDGLLYPLRVAATQTFRMQHWNYRTVGRGSRYFHGSWHRRTRLHRKIHQNPPGTGAETVSPSSSRWPQQFGSGQFAFSRKKLFRLFSFRQVSSNHAIGTAMRHIERGDAKVMTGGGAESSVTPLGMPVL